MIFKPCDTKLFFSKNDPDDPRLGEIVRPFNDKENIEEAIVIQGYPDDEGIKINGGRIGSALAPAAIRKILYKMTPALESPIPTIRDLGDLENTGTLSERHTMAFKSVKNLLKNKARVLSLGGGHDYGYSDCAAFTETILAEGKRPLIINFDAHLDVRPDHHGENSGTSFYRLLKKFSKEIDFFEIGIQDWCNSTKHLHWAKEMGAHVITLNEILAGHHSLNDFVSEKILKVAKKDSQMALSLDIDCVSSRAGLGASQIFPIGLDPAALLQFWKNMACRFQPRLAAIYEVSPPLDQDDGTSRLGAIFAHQFIFSKSK